MVCVDQSDLGIVCHVTAETMITLLVSFSLGSLDYGHAVNGRIQI